MRFYVRAACGAAGMLATAAVDTLTNAALTAAEGVVVVGSAVGALLEEWRS